MHLPKLSLIASGLSCMSRIQGILVHPRQRKMMKNDLQLVAVFLFDLLEFRIKQAARRTLIVAVLFEHYRRTDFDVRFRQSGRVGRRLPRSRLVRSRTSAQELGRLV